MENFEKRYTRSMENREKIDEVYPEKINNKFIKTLEKFWPVAIEEKIVRDKDGEEEIEYTTNVRGASYFWLVRFDNGFRIPYPLMNLEGENSNMFMNGMREKSEEEKNDIHQKEMVIRLCYIARKNLKKRFEKLQMTALERSKM